MFENRKVAVVIPCFRVAAHILGLIQRIDATADLIFVVDDACPEGTGDLVQRSCSDARVRVLRCLANQGVGGAVLTGYAAAIEAGADIIVKLDGDGQMDPALMPAFVAPIVRGEADYTKGNRFFDVETVREMPMLRLVGNAGLSFLTKLSSGYWNLFDPTNGYTAICAPVAAALPAAKISRRYFFESDVLFRLNTMRAVVLDVPMFASYGEEISNLRVSREMLRFFFMNLRNILKRLAYSYFVRNFNFASVELLLGPLLLAFGFVFGGFEWMSMMRRGQLASAGTVMLAALPVLMGLQLFLGFINFDMTSVPSIPLQSRLHADARRLFTRLPGSRA